MEYELYHHGVKGQKWGVRRYVNEDGSLTSLGRSRARSTARAEIRAQVAKEGSQNSITQLGRNINAKRYARNEAKYKAGVRELGERQVAVGRAQVSRFRSNVMKGIMATNTVSKYASIGSGVLSSTLLTVSGHPLLGLYTAATTAGGVAARRIDAAGYGRTRGHYANMYKNNKAAFEKDRALRNKRKYAR